MIRHAEMSLRDKDEEWIDWEKQKSTFKYLSHMRIEFNRHAPTDDDDGGSAFLDINTGEAYTY